MTDEQHSQAGCSAGRLEQDFYHGLLEMGWRPGDGAGRWVRLTVTAGALWLLLWALTSAHRVPGAAGTVLRSNLARDRDAGAMIYTDLGDWRDLERAVRAARRGRPGAVRAGPGSAR